MKLYCLEIGSNGTWAAMLSVAFPPENQQKKPTMSIFKCMPVSLISLLYCRSHLGCFLGSRVRGLIRCRWTGTRRPSSMISMARSASILEHSWLKRTTGCSVTPTASTCPTGGLLSAAATTHRWVSGLQICSHIHPHKPAITNTNLLSLSCISGLYAFSYPNQRFSKTYKGLGVWCEIRKRSCIACHILVIWNLNCDR